MVYLLPIDFNQMNFGRRALETTRFDLWATQNGKERAVPATTIRLLSV
jgi:hypothetical protein